MPTLAAAKITRLNDAFNFSPVLALVTGNLSAFAFTADAATDILTATGHDFVDGTPLRVTNVGGGLPDGLDANTLYFAVNGAANTLQLALSVGGDPVDIGSVGSGVHTITEQAIANIADLYNDAAIVWDVLVRHEVSDYQGDGRKQFVWGGATLTENTGQVALPGVTLSIIPINGQITYRYWVILRGANTTQGDSSGSVEIIEDIGESTISLQGENFVISHTYL